MFYNQGGSKEMHEQSKIREAKYFLNQMAAVVNDRDAFNFNLSAFLAAARSSLQYTLKEAKSKPGGQAWYDLQVGGKTTVRFLKDKRDISIHEVPVSPSAKIGVEITDTLHVSDSLSVTIYRKDGTIEEDRSLSSPPPRSKAPETKTEMSYEYFFSDWTGSENVVELTRMYINEIEAIIRDGVANGFLTS